MKKVYVAKNVSLEYGVFQTILGFAEGRRYTFSKALNEIIRQWDEISVHFMKIKAEKQIEEIKKAKVVKNDAS